jgi:adenosylcobinamide-phosphate synthase
MSLTIVLAILIDFFIGEPKKYHPLVGYGYLANGVETIFRNPNHTAVQQNIMGLIALTSLLFPFVFFIYFLNQWEVFSLFLSPIVLYFCIAAKSLKQHSNLVLQAFETNDLELAKKKVAMIVSRETEKMTTTDICKATVESILENGADAVFAPIFWFIVAGPTGAILYRLSNTLDAMWGYKNQRFIHFGWAAARFDDVLNWIPARLTAFSYALLGRTTLAFTCWKNQAQLLDSPNAGPVMTAGAGALDIQLGGPAWYHGKLKNKILFGTKKITGIEDINRANSLITQSLFLWVFILLMIDFLGVTFA